ncbi:MAG: ShlB/FhaC/HecB family hemolysin secretion/activation protein [Pseudomonadota bacterium]
MRCRIAHWLPVVAFTAAAGGAVAGNADAARPAGDEAVWKGMFNLDNGGARQDGRNQASQLLRNRNMWELDNAAGLQYGAADETPGRLRLFGGIDAPGGNKGAMFGARYRQALAGSGNFAGSLSYGVDYRTYKNSVLQQDVEQGNEVTLHPLSVNYSGNWILDDGAVSSSLTLLHNISGGVRGGQDDFTRVRAGASADYSIVRLAASLTKQLPRDFQVRAVVHGQYTRDALVPGEQFGAGGTGSVRGFSARALSNDYGMTANVELYSPELCGVMVRWHCRALLFYDKGYIKRNRELAGELRSGSIGSVGLGLRMNISSNVNMQVDYGHVVRSSVVPQDDKNRLHLRIGLTW